MERTEVLDMMSGLKLYGMRSAYDETLAAAIKRKHEPQRFVGDLLKAQRTSTSEYVRGGSKEGAIQSFWYFLERSLYPQASSGARFASPESIFSSLCGAICESLPPSEGPSLQPILTRGAVPSIYHPTDIQMDGKDCLRARSTPSPPTAKS